ncbi:MAG TPA: zinc-ribbon domain-containing protein [Acidimicrobiales bacterium]|nr:zinc-ribbon domain-containing protein [Acidimicrobiales bacterium]
MRDVDEWLAQWAPQRVGQSRYGHRVTVPTKPRVARAGRSLTAVAPDVADEWDHANNGDVTPDTIGATSTWPAHWVCRTNPAHRWQQPVVQRAGTAAGKRCAWCAVDDRINERRVGPDTGRLAQEINTDLVFSPRNPLPLGHAGAVGWHDWLWTCTDGHEFVASLNQLRRGHTCPHCWTRDRHLARIPAGVEIGDAFTWPGKRSRSAEELRLAAELAEVLPVDFTHNAVRTRITFYDQPFVTPDILISDLRTAIEWDGGRHRDDPAHDDAKDTALTDAGWRIIRIKEKTLSLAVVSDVITEVLSADDPRRHVHDTWRTARRWQGDARYQSLRSEYEVD